MKRLHYIDNLRGLAIFVVVYCHIIGFSLELNQTSAIEAFLTSFFIPLFFFVSGFVGYKENQKWQRSQLIAYIWKKIKTLYVPSVTLVLIGEQIYNGIGTPITFDVLRCGGLAWFTHTLFQMSLLYAVISWIAFRQSFVQKKHLQVCLIMLFAFFFLVLFKYVKVQNHFFSFLNINFLLLNFVYFATGILLSAYKTSFHKYLDGKFGYLFYAMTLIMYLSDLYIHIHWLVKVLSILIFLYIFFYRIRIVIELHQHQKPLLWSPFNILSLWGRYSLEIFFLNSFLLFKLPPELSMYINYVAGTECFAGPGSVSFVELLIVGTISAITIFFCIVLQWILKKLPIIPTFLFGR